MKVSVIGLLQIRPGFLEKKMGKVLSIKCLHYLLNCLHRGQPLFGR